MRRVAKYTFLAVAAFLGACSQGVEERKLSLIDRDDSISYAASVYMAQEMRQIMTQLEVDASVEDDFVRGVRDAFPMNDDKRSLAYSSGQMIGARAVAMLEQAQKIVYGNDTTKRIDPEIFLEGVVASAYAKGKNMELSDALEYYNQYKYRGESDDFIADNAKRAGVVTLPSGLQYKMETKGGGALATLSDTVCCIYKGTFTNGRTFDTSRGNIVKLPVSTLIPGFSEALLMLPEGSKCKVYIPWELGYGAHGNELVPPYCALVFDIEVVKVLRK